VATRLYPDPTNTPAVSPAYDSSWGQTSAAVRRALVIGTAGNNASTDFSDAEVSATAISVLLVQFVTLPLNAVTISGAADWAFRGLESSPQMDANLRVVVRKCDEDGSNPTTGDIFDDGTEIANDVLTNRYDTGSPSQTLSASDRLVVEVGYYAANTKTNSYTGTVNVTDNHATTDLGENDTDTTAFNSWVEFVETLVKATIQGTAADTANFAETAARIATLRATSTDTMNAADTDAGLGQYLASLSDTATATDTATTIASLLASVTDTATVTDSVVRGLLLLAQTADTATLTDAVTKLLLRYGTATDTILFEEHRYNIYFPTTYWPRKYWPEEI
jgi:hypothetical protein